MAIGFLLRPSVFPFLSLEQVSVVKVSAVLFSGHALQNRLPIFLYAIVTKVALSPPLCAASVYDLSR